MRRLENDVLRSYVALGTLHGGDAAIRSREMRRAVRAQMVVSLFFNTVVLAMLVSLLMR